MTPILYAAAGLLLGGAIGYILFLRVLTSKAKSIVREAELEGESRKEKKMLQAKERFIELKEKQANQRKDLDRKLNDREDRIKKTEANLQRTIDQNKNSERQLEFWLEHVSMSDVPMPRLQFLRTKFPHTRWGTID